MLTNGKLKMSKFATGNSFGTFVIELIESITKYTGQKKMPNCITNIVIEPA